MKVQQAAGFVDGLGLKGFSSYQIQKKFSCSNISRAACVLVTAILGAMFLVAGIAIVSTASCWVHIVAGIGALIASLILSFVTFHWSYSVFLSCKNSKDIQIEG